MADAANGLRVVAGGDGKLEVCHHHLAESGQHGLNFGRAIVR
jgi:hypothetical protein